MEKIVNINNLMFKVLFEFTLQILCLICNTRQLHQAEQF